MAEQLEGFICQCGGQLTLNGDLAICQACGDVKSVDWSWLDEHENLQDLQH